MEHLRDLPSEPGQWNYEFHCLSCGKHNDLWFEGLHKPRNVKQICEFCGQDQEELINEPDEYDAFKEEGRR